ncbi:hypothetical protein H4Q26_005901 [Puccinia striiformis f. sp. tritici PST-130]|nr:hypothetical protein H4Q26_005901 [Puccinia striiformis f. sp. tritici PST-130]
MSDSLVEAYTDYKHSETYNTGQIDLDSHSKRFACTQTSNSIDRRSKSDSAQPSELLLDNQPSRNNDANCVPLQTSLTKSSSNRNLKSYLIDRITLPSQGKVFTYTYEVRSSTDEFTYDSTTLTKKRNHIVTQKVHSEHLPTVYYQDSSSKAALSALR